MTAPALPARRLDALQLLLRLLMVAIAIAGLLPAVARADFLQCNYPERCFFFDIVPGLGNIRGFIKRGPTEMESQHWQLEYGSGGLTVNIGGNIPELNINGGAQAGVSVTLSWSGWVCPDERYECPEPTIIQTWNKERPKPSKAIPVRVRPIAALFGAPWPPVDDVNLPRGWMLESPPDPRPDYPGGPGPFLPPPPAIPPAPPANPGILPPTVIAGD